MQPSRARSGRSDAQHLAWHRKNRHVRRVRDRAPCVPETLDPPSRPGTKRARGHRGANVGAGLDNESPASGRSNETTSPSRSRRRIVLLIYALGSSGDAAAATSLYLCWSSHIVPINSWSRLCHGGGGTGQRAGAHCHGRTSELGLSKRWYSPGSPCVSCTRPYLWRWQHLLSCNSALACCLQPHTPAIASDRTSWQQPLWHSPWPA